MKVEIENGRLIVTPITRDEEKLVFAMAAAFAAFEAVVSPVTGEAVRCNEDDKKKMFSFDSKLIFQRFGNDKTSRLKRRAEKNRRQ